MNRPRIDHTALNLSFVLHERSDSDTVRRYLRAAQAERKRCAQATRELAALPDEALAQRIILLDRTGRDGAPAHDDELFVSLNIGAIELLPRLLRITGYSPLEAESSPALLDGPQTPSDHALSFFGAPAALVAPPLSGTRLVFTTAVFRPGYSSILLRATSLDTHIETGSPNWRQAAQLAEEVIREFPLQWWCERPLWPRPVEETLPEFRATGNGASACGR
ncbi:MAG TPA: hypothetical protein VHA53_02620 [Nitrolancea sp.]|nr:hypothetical protein [Nitrolancea sp.]